MSVIIGTIASLLAPYASDAIDNILGQVAEKLHLSEVFRSQELFAEEDEEE